MKNVIITGAGGLVATELVVKLLKDTDFNLYLLSTDVEKIAERYKNYPQRVNCYTLDGFISYASATKVKYDICIHTAFSRSAKGGLIVDSIEYQRALIALLKKLGIGIFVNISSQSVYGKITEPLWKENTPLDPDYLYAMGKYFSEMVTKIMLESSCIRWTNLRLCSVCENARFVRVFVQNAIEGKPIILTAPEQQCSFIDVQDVADALMTFIENVDDMELMPCYNLGANIVDTIKGIAFRVKRIGEERYGLSNVEIIENSAGNNIHIGMDSSLFMKTFGWSPRYNMDDMIIEMFEMFINVNGGGIRLALKLFMNIRRFKQVGRYGWRHAGQIAESMQLGIFYRIRVFFDIIYCFCNYRMWSNQYLKENFHRLGKHERETIGRHYREDGLKRDAWQKDFVANRKFLVKYGNVKYELSHLRDKRNKAYTKYYHAGPGLMVEYNVNISRQHYLNGSIQIGKNVLFAKNVFIDYSGEVVIGDNVKFSNGAIVESHTHLLFSDPSVPASKAIPTKVMIEDGVCLGSNCIILDSCARIGRNARIAAGAVVRNSIPPYAVVAGNPGKIIGFVYSPDEVRAYEEKKYKEKERISISKYEKDYEKFFLNRISEIRLLLKN